MQSQDTTESIPYDATAETVETELNELSTIGGVGGRVSVTGGPGDSTGTSPYVVTLEASLAGDEGRTLSSVSSLVKSGGSPSATVNTVATGGGMEVCNAHLDVCDFGKANVKAPGDNGLLAAVAVAPAGAPNEGDVLHVSPSARRIEEFTGNGQLREDVWVERQCHRTRYRVRGVQRRFGPYLPKRDERQQPEDTLAAASVMSRRIQPVPSTSPRVRSANRRVQVFTPAGGESLTPSLFGTSEKQAVTVKATGGQFKLGFGVQEGGTAGTRHSDPRLQSHHQRLHDQRQILRRAADAQQRSWPYRLV